MSSGITGRLGNINIPNPLGRLAALVSGHTAALLRASRAGRYQTCANCKAETWHRFEGIQKFPKGDRHLYTCTVCTFTVSEQ